MKLLKYISLLIAAAGIFFTGCNEEENIRFELEDAQRIVNFRIQFDQNFTFFDFEDLDNAKIVYDVFSESTNFQEATVFLSYYNITGDTTSQELIWREYTLADFNNGQIHEEISSQDMANFLNLPNGIDDMAGGDLFNFRLEVLMDNGKVYPDTVLKGTPFQALNVSPAIQQSAATTSFTPTFSTFVGCPSQIPTGTFTLIVNGTPGAGGDIPGVPSNPGTVPAVDVEFENVTITRTGPVSYQVSQGDQIWQYWYSGIGYTGFSNPGNIQDICEVLQGSFATQFVSNNFVPIIQPTSTFDNDAGTITIDWVNGFGGSGTFEFVP